MRRIVRAADARLWLRDVSLAEHNIWNWSKRGYYPTQHCKVRRRRRTKSLTLFGLISVRLIALMRSFGLAWPRIKQAYYLYAEATGEQYPFATRALWTDDTPRSEHIYAALDDQPAHPDADVPARRRRRLTYGEYRATTIIPASGLVFHDDSDELDYWEPSDGVWLNPWYQSSQPCVKGSRVPTGILMGLHSVGMDIGEILE